MPRLIDILDWTTPLLGADFEALLPATQGTAADRDAFGAADDIGVEPGLDAETGLRASQRDDGVSTAQTAALLDSMERAGFPWDDIGAIVDGPSPVSYSGPAGFVGTPDGDDDTPVSFPSPWTDDGASYDGPVDESPLPSSDGSGEEESSEASAELVQLILQLLVKLPGFNTDTSDLFDDYGNPKAALGWLETFVEDLLEAVQALTAEDDGPDSENEPGEGEEPGEGAETIPQHGTSGNDLLTGGPDSQIVMAYEGNDTITTGAGDDLIQGGGGNDIIDAGAGDDQLWGGLGADTFIFADGHGDDMIHDFHAASDAERIDLSAVSALNSFDDLLADGVMEAVGPNVRIDTGGGNSIWLTNVAIEDLDRNDFLF